MVLGSYRHLNPHRNLQPYEIVASQYIQASWAAFVHSPNDGLEKVLGWPQYRPNRESFLTVRQAFLFKLQI
jgi:hypothetical protein